MRKLGYNEQAYEALAAYLRGGRLPHAILLEGGAGSGKSTFAMEIAAGALCTAEPADKPCGVCRDCRKVEKGVHPDVLVYRGEGGSRSFHVDTVRALRQEAYVRPGEGSHKILLLEDVQSMTAQASNALLKVLEEPPPRVLFILTCENKAALLDTILSRVALLHLRTPTPAGCAGILEEMRPGLEDGAYRQAASAAGGSVGKALALLDGESGGEAGNTTLDLLYLLCCGSELDALAKLSAFEKDKDGFALLLDELSGQVRELLTAPTGENPVAKRILARVSPLQLMQILAIIEEIASAVPANVNRLLLVTNLCAGVRLALTT